LRLTPFFVPRIGGLERNVWRTSKILAEKGLEIDVVTRQHDAKLPRYEEMDGIRVHRIPVGPLTAPFRTRLLRAWIWLIRHIELLWRADIVHCHDFLVFCYWYLPFRFLFFWKPVFITFHGWGGTCPPSSKETRPRRLAARLTRGNICNGHYIDKWYGTKATFVNYTGVDIPARVAEPRPLSAVFIGRLAVDQAPDIYLRALAILRDKHGIELSLDVCGDGPLRSEMEDLAHSLKVNATFRGFVDDPLPLLEASEFAFVSGQQSLLQGMAYRRPVFSVYSCPLKRDYFAMMPVGRDCICLAASPEELAAQIVCAIEHPEATRVRVEKGVTWARTQTWESVANQYLRLWGLQ